MKILNFSKKILLAAMVACTVIGCALAFNGKTAKADGLPNDAKIVATEYPSLKINEKGGMRFIIEMNAAAKTYIEQDENLELHAFVGPVALLNKSEDEFVRNAINIKLEKTKFYQETGNTDKWYANACVVNMLAANRDLDYTVIAAVQNGDTVVTKVKAADGVKGNIYNIATRALLDTNNDYTAKILGLTAYNWLGSEDFPLDIDTTAKYDDLVAKVNGGAAITDKYIKVYKKNKSEKTFAEGKALPNLIEYNKVTFANEDGSVLATVAVKDGENATYDTSKLTKAGDDDVTYSFDKWVTEQGGSVEAVLGNITADKTVYASFKATYKNAITSFTAEDSVCGEDLKVSATAKYGTVEFKYSALKNGSFGKFENVYDKVGNYTYFVKAFVTAGEGYEGAESEKVLSFKFSHKFVDGVCSVCNKTQDGILYEIVDDYAYISGYDGNHSLEIYPAATYEGKTVIGVKSRAFIDRSTIKKVVLPSTVTKLGGSSFNGCKGLEYVSMTGIKSLVYAESGDNNFMNCVSLHTVIMAANFTANCQQFFAASAPETPILDILVDGESGEPTFTSAKNLLSGKVFYKVVDTVDAKCLQWNYDENGNAVKGASEHTWKDDGTCETCGKYGDKLTGGVNYQYDATNSVYYVGLNKTLATPEVNILGKYNDGMHGEKAVTFVRSNAFNNNTNITKVILPESVKRLDGNVFNGCSNLAYVSMLGIEDMIFANITVCYQSGVVTTNNNFLGCSKLTVLIVGEKFNLYPNGDTSAQQFPKQSYNACIDMYVYGTSVNFTRNTNDPNGLLTGNIYYYSESAPTDTENTYWHYVDKVATLWA